tara:strand:+ start:108404 stop:108838 length:435 start_codon:yes stop_codon:yes gene_type:complete
MSNNEKLIGQYVTVYLSGGWELSGEIRIVKEDKFFIDNDEKTYLVLRDKISAICVNASKRDSSVPSNHPAALVPKKDADAYSPDGKSVGNDMGMSIPFDMLTDEAQRENNGDDFSISFGKSSPAADGPESGIVFSIKDKSSGDK